MAALADIQAKIYKLTGTDSTSYPNSEMVVDMNLANQNITGAILEAMDESDYDDQRQSDYPIYTFPLSTNRDYWIGQSYGILKIKDFSVTYDGVNYYRATPIDSAEATMVNAPASATTMNTTIDGRFDKTAPRYDYKYGALWLYPRANSTDVANGAAAVVEFYRAPVDYTTADLSAGTAIPGFDNHLHFMLAYGTAFEYCLPKQLPQLDEIANELAKYELKLQRHYSSKNKDRRYALGGDIQNYK